MMSIELTGSDGTTVVLRASGGYSPDVMNDLKARAVESLVEAIAYQWPDGLTAAGVAAMKAAPEDDEEASA